MIPVMGHPAADEPYEKIQSASGELEDGETTAGNVRLILWFQGFSPNATSGNIAYWGKPNNAQHSHVQHCSAEIGVV